MEPEDIVITLARAQSLLRQMPLFCKHEIRDILEETAFGDEVDDLTVDALYLGNLCARGDLDGVKKFLRETEEKEPEELDNILNHCPQEQWYGNCLHMVANWNTGDKALEMFDILFEHGAKLYENYYDHLPWEKTGGLFITPITQSTLGKRNPAEFSSTKDDLCEIYGDPTTVNCPP